MQLHFANLKFDTKVHIIAATGFWCETLAPQHPWVVRLGVADGGVDEMAELFVREINDGPSDAWGQRFTGIPAGIIKIGTSGWMRPSERVCHVAAARASQETGCPITTHTTDGGGLEQAQLLLEEGAAPERVIIGHQGNQAAQGDGGDVIDGKRRHLGLLRKSAIFTAICGSLDDRPAERIRNKSHEGSASGIAAAIRCRIARD